MRKEIVGMARRVGEFSVKKIFQLVREESGVSSSTPTKVGESLIPPTLQDVFDLTKRRLQERFSPLSILGEREEAFLQAAEGLRNHEELGRDLVEGLLETQLEKARLQRPPTSRFTLELLEQAQNLDTPEGREKAIAWFTASGIACINQYDRLAAHNPPKDFIFAEFRDLDLNDLGRNPLLKRTETYQKLSKYIKNLKP